MSFIGKWFGFGREELYDQAQYAYDHGDWDCAIERFEACISDSQDAAMVRLAKFHLAECYAQLGTEYIRKEDPVDAVMNLRKAVQLSPRYPDLQVLLSKAYRALGDVEERRKCLEEALAINPKYVDAILQQGILLYETGSHEEGLERVRQAALVDPTLDRSKLEQAEEAHAKAQISRATAALHSLDAGEGQSEDVLVKLAGILARDNMFEEAGEAYRQAIENCEGFPDLHYRYAAVLLELGRDDEAIVELRRAIELNPKYTEAHALLGTALHRTQKEAEARTEFEKALQLDPMHSVAKAEVERLRTA